MASAEFDRLNIRGKHRVVIHGSFKPNGSSAVDNTANTGNGLGSATGIAAWQVTRTGTGAFSVTLGAAYGFDQLDCFLCGVQQNTAIASICVISGAVTTTATTGVIPITIMTESAGSFSAADINAGTNVRVHFVAIFRNSKVLP